MPNNEEIMTAEVEESAAVEKKSARSRASKATKEKKSSDTAAIKPKRIRIPDDMKIHVQSNVFGKLTYVSRKTGETIQWTRFGEILPMKMADLREMKAGQVAFFEHNWISVIDIDADEDMDLEPADIYADLYVDKYYKNQIDPSNYHVVCSWSAEKIAKDVPLLARGAKRNLAVALNDFIESGELDSLKKIKAFEVALGCTLKKPE